MKSTLIVGLVAALTLTVAAQQKPAAPPQAAEAALGAAIHLEEVERNLDGAIVAYKAFLSRYGSNRPLAAKAQYRLGRAYELRGDAQARQAYERVVRDFGDQKDVVAAANQRLAALALPAPRDTQTVRFVLIGSGQSSMLGVSVSPDGRWLARRNPSLDDGDPSNNNGDLVVSELATGRVMRLASGTCIQGSKGCMAASPVFSPNARQIVYQWRDQLAPNGELRLIANEPGAKFRSLFRDPQISAIPLDWSPDGRSILTALINESAAPVRQDFGLVSVSDGSYRVVTSLGTRRVLLPRPRVSPDGRFIVFPATTGPSNLPPLSMETQIYVAAADGSGEARLTTESINEAPIWTPDGGHIVFASNRSGAFGLWAIPMRNGKPAGPAVPVRRDTGRIESIGMTRAGSLYYVPHESTGEGQSMLEVGIDPATGKAITTRREISERSVGLNCCAAWSPDGKSVAFKRRRPENQNISDLVVRSDESKAERTYTAPEWVNVTYGFGPGAPKWLADGSGFFVGIEPIPGETRWLGRMTLDGQFTRFVQIPAELGWVAALSPDSSTAYVLTRKGNPLNGTYAGMAAVDLTTGAYRRIFQTQDGHLSSVDASPDARTLALFIVADPGGRATSAIATMAVDGSNYREIYMTKQPPIATIPEQLQWSRDGQSLFFQEAGRLMRISSRGGAPEYTGVARSGRDPRFWVSPDGTRIAFNEGAPLARFNEVWAIDNLMSALKTGR